MLGWFPQNRRPGRPGRTLLDRAFLLSILLKGLDGVLELLGGLLLLLAGPARLTDLARILTRHELSQDPGDLVAYALLQVTSNLSISASLFGALYLLAHGVVKVILVAALLTNKLWAYPWMIGFLTAFIGYQVYRLTFAPSWWLTLLTAFDIVVVCLTWLEYRRHRRHRAEVTETSAEERRGA